jgi:hypothetical protein
MSLSQHNIHNIYRKAALNSQLIPAEVILLVKDLHTRVTKLEERAENAPRLEEPKPDRRRSSKVSKKKVSSD